MKPAHSLMLACAFAGLLTLTGCCRGRVAQRSSEVVLFDGETLNGWVQRGGSASYTVADGCIVGETRPKQPNSFLCTTADYADFQLSLEFLVDDGLNSGVQIRSRVSPEHGRVQGYQVEIDPSDRAWTGGIYEESGRGWLDDLSDSPAARDAYRPREWNELRVVAEGDRIRTWINGVPAADLRDSNAATGFIALQVHGVGDRADPLRVRWRNLRLMPLTSPSSGAGSAQDPAAPPSR